jgi:hypothetical protein
MLAKRKGLKFCRKDFVRHLGDAKHPTQYTSEPRIDMPTTNKKGVSECGSDVLPDRAKTTLNANSAQPIKYTPDFALDLLFL